MSVIVSSVLIFEKGNFILSLNQADNTVKISLYKFLTNNSIDLEIKANEFTELCDTLSFMKRSASAWGIIK